MILSCSLIGLLLLFIPTTYNRGPNDPSTWMSISMKLTDTLIKD